MTPFVPLPLVGRVDARSAAGWGSCEDLLKDPHPHPSPQGGGEPMSCIFSYPLKLKIPPPSHADRKRPRARSSRWQSRPPATDGDLTRTPRRRSPAHRPCCVPWKQKILDVAHGLDGEPASTSRDHALARLHR